MYEAWISRAGKRSEVLVKAAALRPRRKETHSSSFCTVLSSSAVREVAADIGCLT
jgi:hypothetical protein